MNCQVYLKDGLLCVGFNQSSMMFGEMEYTLGDGATNFSVFPENNLRLMLGQFRAEFLLSVENKETQEELLDKLKGYVEMTSNINPYYNFYMDIYVFILLCLQAQKSETPEVIKKFVGKSIQFDFQGVDFTDLSEASLWVAGVLIEDFRERKARLKENYEAITDSAEEQKGLTPMHRLYLLSIQGRNFLSGQFKTSLKPNYLIDPKEKDLDKIKSTLLENKVDIVEMVDIRNMDDLLSYELYHTLKNDLLIR